MSHLNSNTSLNGQMPVISKENGSIPDLSFGNLTNSSPVVSFVSVQGDSALVDMYPKPSLPMDQIKMNMESIIQSHSYDRMANLLIETSTISHGPAKPGSGLSSEPPPLTEQEAREIQESLNALFNLTGSS